MTSQGSVRHARGTCPGKAADAAETHPGVWWWHGLIWFARLGLGLSAAPVAIVLPVAADALREEKL